MAALVADKLKRQTLSEVLFEATELHRATGQEADPDYLAGLTILPGYVTNMTTPSTFKVACK